MSHIDIIECDRCKARVERGVAARNGWLRMSISVVEEQMPRRAGSCWERHFCSGCAGTVKDIEKEDSIRLPDGVTGEGR